MDSADCGYLLIGVTDSESFQDRPLTPDPGSEHGVGGERASPAATRPDRETAAELLAHFAQARPETPSLWHVLSGDDDDDQ